MMMMMMMSQFQSYGFFSPDLWQLAQVMWPGSSHVYRGWLVSVLGHSSRCTLHQS